MTSPGIVGAVLRIDLRGFTGDPPAELGAPMRDVAEGATRSLFYDLTAKTEGCAPREACGRIAQILDRWFLAPDEPPFSGALARRMRLDLGLAAPGAAEPWSHDLPHGLLDCLGQLEADLGLSYYPCPDETGPA